MTESEKSGAETSAAKSADTESADAKSADIKSMSFEDALKELERIVSKLESGEAPLQESISIYERGEALKAHCESLLKAAEARIEKITLDREGNPTGTQPLDEQQ